MPMACRVSGHNHISYHSFFSVSELTASQLLRVTLGLIIRTMTESDYALDVYKGSLFHYI